MDHVFLSRRKLKVGIFLGDITAAFDRLAKDFLMATLQAAGIPDAMLDFLNVYLAERIGHIRVDGAVSDAIAFTDTVFQGTVLGPYLWNTFFANVSLAASGGLLRADSAADCQLVFGPVSPRFHDA